MKARLQEWVDRPMRILLSRATHFDRNFSVGLGLVVILGALEIFSASFYYISRIRAGGTSAQSVATTIVRRSAASVTPTSIGRAISQTKLRELGPSAGAAYELADRRLKPGAPAAAGAGIANASFDAVASRNDVGGIPEGSTFGITEVKTTETPDPDTETNLMLRIGIKKQPKATIDHTKVKIQVFFYDTVDDKDIKLTDADVNYEWLTPKHDWTDTNPEILSVSYLRPKNKAISSESALSAAAAAVKVGQKGRTVKASSSTEGGERRYLGYRVLVYYNDKLQAVQAEPARLLQLFPASESISSP